VMLSSSKIFFAPDVLCLRRKKMVSACKRHFDGKVNTRAISLFKMNSVIIYFVKCAFYSAVHGPYLVRP